MPAGRKPKRKVKTIQVRNMVSTCCVTLLNSLLTSPVTEVQEISLGKVTLSYDPGKIKWESIVKILEENGFGIIEDREKILVEQIKLAVIDLVHHTTYNAMVRNSDYLVERFSMSYPYLSSLFSRHEATTLEKFIILHKIEKVKELIDYGELSLSEIAFMMGYSSVQYLSTQFKNITGISVTEYRNDPSVTRQPLDSI